MTLRLIDGFDYYSQANYAVISAANGWVSGAVNTYPDPDTAFGYGFAQSQGGTSENSRYKIRTARGRWIMGDTYVIGQRMRVPGGTGGLCFGVRDSFASIAEQWYLRFDYTGSITLHRGDNNSTGPVMAKTLSGCFAADQWFYVEVKWTPKYLNGFFEVRINTVPVLTMTTAITAQGSLVFPATEPGFDLIFYSCPASGAGWLQDDFYFLDSQGDLNNDYLGNVRVKCQEVIGQDTTQWDIGGTDPAPTNWQSVINKALNDTKYVSSSLAGEQDFYNVSPNVNAPFVHGFELSGAYRQDDATQRVSKNAYKLPSGTVVYGGDNYLNQSYTFHPDLFEINPDTGIEFTQGEINALRIGPCVVT